MNLLRLIATMDINLSDCQRVSREAMGWRLGPGASMNLNTTVTAVVVKIGAPRFEFHIDNLKLSLFNVMPAQESCRSESAVLRNKHARLVEPISPRWSVAGGKFSGVSGGH
jgi:hypothetical protein